MCDACKMTAAPDRSQSPTRRRLWEIEDGHHCSIIGTCLGLGDLRKIAAKAGFDIGPEVSEYRLHGFFVRAARGDTADYLRLSRLTGKTLDRRFAVSIDAFRAAKTACDLSALWDKALHDGNIPGPYWALMTHPRLTPELTARAFGEVHMLSHLVGASNRADIRQIKRLEEAAAATAEKAARDVRRLRERLTARDEEVAALGLALAEARREAGGGGPNADNLNSSLHAVIEELRNELDHETTRAAQAKSRLRARVARLEAKTAELREKCAALTAERDERAADCEALETELAALEAERGETGTGPKDAEINLSGSRILYLGGRRNLYPHYRSVVARHNGDFLFHDGGQEDGDARLPTVLTQADVVLCPVDCVSHRAALDAKKHCQACGKCFIPLNGSGLSALLRGLKTVAAPQSRSNGAEMAANA